MRSTRRGDWHGVNRTALTAGPPFPHVMAARPRQLAGTLTSTGRGLARTTMPAFSQYGQRGSVLRTT